MYCLIQLYIPISTHLAPQKPLLKLFAVKAVGMYLLLVYIYLTYPRCSFSHLLASDRLIGAEYAWNY